MRTTTSPVACRPCSRSPKSTAPPTALRAMPTPLQMPYPTASDRPRLSAWPIKANRPWGVLASRLLGPGGSAGEFVDAEGEAPVANPIAGEPHRDHAHPFQPVRHFQAADVQRAQPEALDKCRHARLGLRIV